MKRIMVVLMSIGCFAVPACLDGGLGFGVSNVGVDVCYPGKGIFNVCADVDTPIDFNELFTEDDE